MAEPSGSGNQDDQGAKRNGRRKKKHHLGIRYLPDNSDDSSESQDLSSASHEVSSVYRTISLGASPTGEIPPEAASSSHHDVVEMEEGSLPPPARFGRSPSDVLGVSPMSMAASPSLYLMPELGESPSDLMIQQQQQMEMMSSSSSIPGSIKDSQTSSHSEITVSTMSSSMSTSDLPELPFDSPKRLPPVPLVVGGEKTSPQHHKAGPSKGGGGEKKSPHKKGQAKTTPSGDIEMEDFRSEGTSSPMAVDDEDPEVVLTEEEKRKKEAAAKKKKEKSEKDAGKRNGDQENK